MSINSSFTLYPRAGSAFSSYQTAEFTQREKPSLLVQALIRGEISGDDAPDRLIRGTVLPNLRAKRIQDAKKDTSSAPKAYAPFEPLINQRNMSSGTISCLSHQEFKAWKGVSQLANPSSGQAMERTVDWDKSLSHTQRLQQEVRKIIETQVKHSEIYKVPRAIRVNPFELSVTDRKLKNGTISPFLHDEYRAWNKTAIVRFQNNFLCDEALGDNDGNWKWRCYKAEIGRCDARKQMLHTMEENRQMKIQMIQCKGATLGSHQNNAQAERQRTITDSASKKENCIENFNNSGFHNEIGSNKRANTSFVNKRRGDCAQDSPLYDFSVEERSMLHDREVEVENTNTDSANQADESKLTRQSPEKHGYIEEDSSLPPNDPNQKDDGYCATASYLDDNGAELITRGDTDTDSHEHQVQELNLSFHRDIDVSALTSMSFGSVNKKEDVQNALAAFNDSGSPKVSANLQQQKESTDKTGEWTENERISENNMDDMDSKTPTANFPGTTRSSVQRGAAKLHANAEQTAITLSSEVSYDNAMTSPSLLGDQENAFKTLSASKLKPLQEVTNDLSSIGSIDARDDIIDHGPTSRSQDKGGDERRKIQSKTSISPPLTRSSVKKRESQEIADKMICDSKIITSSKRTDSPMSDKIEAVEADKESDSRIVSKKHRKDGPKSEDDDKMAPSFSSNNTGQNDKKKRGRRRRGIAIANFQAPVIKKTRSRTRR